MNTHDKLKLAAEIGVELPHYTNTEKAIDFPVRGADRIKELAEQYHTRLGAETNIVELEEFTRLLLLEVIRKITEEQTAVDAYWFCNDGYLITQKLRQHFEVA